MRIHKIIIQFEPSNDKELPHASQVEMMDGKWTADGPVYNRYTGVIHEIWQVLRKMIKNGEE
jgi:hypothetical protein